MGVLYIIVRHGCRGVCSCAFVPFPFALGFVRVRSVHFPAPWVIVGCVQTIPVRPGERMLHPSIHVRAGDCRVRLIAFGPFPCAEGYVRSIPVHPGGGRVRSCAFGLIANAMVVVGFVCERPAHFRAP